MTTNTREECEHPVIDWLPAHAPTGGGTAMIRVCADCGADIDSEDEEG